MVDALWSKTRLDIAGFRIPVGLDLLLSALLVTVVVRIGAEFTMGPERFSSLRLGNGIMLGILLSVPRKYWPAYLAAGFLGNMAATIYIPGEVRGYDVSLLIAGIVTIERYFCALALQPYLKQLPNSNGLKFAMAFVVIALVAAPLGGAVIAGLMLAAIKNQNFLSVFWEWLISGSLGTAIMAPLMLVARQADIDEFIHHRLDRKALAILAATVLATSMIFFFTSLPVPFIILPLTALAAFFTGLTGTVTANFLVALIVIVATLTGHGPFMVSSDAIVNLRLAQAFIFVSILISLTLAISLTGYRRATRSSQIVADDLKKQLHTDQATALPNRHALEEHLEAEWDNAVKTATPLSLAMISIADFESLWGDGSRRMREEGIAEFAHNLHLFVRHTDMLYRFSEGEFALLMPASDSRSAHDTVKALTSVIGSFNVSSARKKPETHIGIGTLQPRPGSSAGDLMDFADRALVASKQKSGNSIEWCGES